MKMENDVPSLLPESKFSFSCRGFAGIWPEREHRNALADGERRRGREGEYLGCIVSRFLCFVA